MKWISVAFNYVAKIKNISFQSFQLSPLGNIFGTSQEPFQPHVRMPSTTTLTTSYSMTKLSFSKAFLDICRQCRHNCRQYRRIPLQLWHIWLSPLFWVFSLTPLCEIRFSSISTESRWIHAKRFATSAPPSRRSLVLSTSSTMHSSAFWAFL
jgi:hypothetical protein